MKNSIRKKLKSTDGISILFGILFFLIASILSVVILSASVAAIKSVTSDRKLEQNYLTCSSAAKTLRDAITGTTITEKTEVIIKKQKPTSTTCSWYADTTSTNLQSFGENYLQSWIEDLATSSVNTGKATHTITIDGIDGMDSVEATVKIKIDETTPVTVGGSQYFPYDLTIVFSFGSGTDSCILTLSLEGQCTGSETTSTSKSGSSTVTTTTTNLNYSWYGANIIYGDRSGEVQ